MNITEENESWTTAEENVTLRGLIKVTTQTNKKQIRQATVNATRKKYAMISDGDFEFL